ncbi:MAG: hypothetical protein ACI31G_00075 [Bacilli bacterium]
MKKSKILVPAIAMLVLSTAAASTATVAWFQSIRRVDLDLSNIHVVNTNSVLEVEATALQGTTVTDTGSGHATQTVKFEPLTHGSYDSASEKAFGVVCDDYGDTLGYSGGFTDFKAYEDDAANNATHGTTPLMVHEVSTDYQVYYAVSFKLKFTLTTSTTNDYALLFDHKVSTVSYSDGGITVEATDPIKGYRLCLQPDGGDALVWAPKQTGTLDDLKYVKEGTPNVSTTYGDEGVKIINATSDEAIEDGTLSITTLEAKENYLATLSSSTTTVEVVATAWFEGEDPNVVNTASNIAEDIKSTMSFYAVKATL